MKKEPISASLRWEAPCPFEPSPRDERDAFAIAMGEHPIPVVLDLMRPVGTGGRGRAGADAEEERRRAKPQFPSKRIPRTGLKLDSGRVIKHKLLIQFMIQQWVELLLRRSRAPAQEGALELPAQPRTRAPPRTRQPRVPPTVSCRPRHSVPPESPRGQPRSANWASRPRQNAQIFKFLPLIPSEHAQTGESVTQGLALGKYRGPVASAPQVSVAGENCVFDERVDLVVPLLAAEHAVMAYPRLHVMPLEVGTQACA